MPPFLCLSWSRTAKVAAVEFSVCYFGTIERWTAPKISDERTVATLLVVGRWLLLSLTRGSNAA